MVFEILFWASLGTLCYVFFGFIAVLWLVSRFQRRPAQKREITPSVSAIVCAFNEERHIGQKIANLLELDYPKERLEIIVVSDGSTDGTDPILEKINDPRIKFHRTGKQQGKTECQNLAVRMAKNNVLFFTDATVMHPPETLKLLVRNLSDASVGCVTGKPVFKQDTGPASMGLSKREQYEFYLRSQLGEIGTLLGAQDCIYLIPRKLYIPVRADLDSGFVGPLKVLEKGYRTVYEAEALALVDRPAPNVKDEFIRRSRIALRGMRALLHMSRLMNPFRYGFTALSLISTRLLRWLTPVFLATLFTANLFLLSSPFYLLTFMLQAGFYILAGVAFLIDRQGRRLSLPFYLPFYFCLLAGSATVGLTRLLAGETGQLWQTRR